MVGLKYRSVSYPGHAFTYSARIIPNQCADENSHASNRAVCVRASLRAAGCVGDLQRERRAGSSACRVKDLERARAPAAPTAAERQSCVSHQHSTRSLVCQWLASQQLHASPAPSLARWEIAPAPRPQNRPRCPPPIEPTVWSDREGAWPRFVPFSGCFSVASVRILGGSPPAGTFAPQIWVPASEFAASDQWFISNVSGDAMKCPLLW